jgi:uncharacterized protein (DUF1330 family)
MTAYWIARAHVNDPAEYQKYADRVPEIIARFGGRFLARGGGFDVLEGTKQFHRFIVIEFPSRDAALACHSSPEYTAAAAFRHHGVGHNELVIVDGLPGDA